MLKRTKMIYDLRDFSKAPFGRYKSDGEFSGEAFREILANKLKYSQEHNEPLIIKLDNVYGLGSSFLEESFGGLVRKGLFTKEELLESSPRLLQIETEFDFYAIEIESYIREAQS